MNLWRQLTTPVFVYRALSHEITKRTLHSIVYKQTNITSQLLNLHPQNALYDSKRCKSKKQKYDADDEDVTFDDDSSLSKDSKVIKFNTTSMRTDTILKSALGVARKTKTGEIPPDVVETIVGIFQLIYVRLGDEIDVVKMASPKNPDHLYVSRVEILNVVPTEEDISVSARRFKNLLIENYEEDPFKGSSQSES